MSKLQELINELCPDGVEYKKIIETTNIMRGKRVIKSQLSDVGKYPVYQNCLTPMGYYENTNCKKNNTFIIVAGAAGEIGYSRIDFWAADDCFCLLCNESLNSRYLYYALLNQKNFILSKVRGASIPRLSRTAVENIIIPIPPLEVQNEIVNILDKFSALIENIDKEIELRQKQYEYYRDKLLTFKAARQ